MFRLDPKQAVLDHVAAPHGAAVPLPDAGQPNVAVPRTDPFERGDRRHRAGDRGAAAGDARLCDLCDLCRARTAGDLRAHHPRSRRCPPTCCSTRRGRIASRPIARRCSRPARVLAAWSVVFIVLMTRARSCSRLRDLCRASGWSAGIVARRRRARRFPPVAARAGAAVDAPRASSSAAR